MRLLPLALLALACNGDPTDTANPDPDTTPSFDDLAAAPQRYYRLVEMSGETLSVTYEGELVDGGAGQVMRFARGYLFLDDDTGEMDLRMTVVNGLYAVGIISGTGTGVWEADGATLMLTGERTWVYDVTPTADGLTLAIAHSDPRNEASQSTLDTYRFVLEPEPANPLEGSWALTERVTDHVQSPVCSLDQDLGLAQIYGIAEGVSTLNRHGGLDFDLHLALWQGGDCSGTPILDLPMTGSGFCSVDAATAGVSCYYPRTDPSGSTVHIRYDGGYVITGDTLDIAVGTFAADSTDPTVTALQYTRVVE